MHNTKSGLVSGAQPYVIRLCENCLVKLASFGIDCMPEDTYKLAIQKYGEETVK